MAFVLPHFNLFYCCPFEIVAGINDNSFVHSEVRLAVLLNVCKSFHNLQDV